MPRKSELDVQGRRPAENPQQPRGDFLRGAARWRVGGRAYPTRPVIFRVIGAMEETGGPLLWSAA